MSDNDLLSNEAAEIKQIVEEGAQARRIRQAALIKQYGQPTPKDKERFVVVHDYEDNDSMPHQEVFTFEYSSLAEAQHDFDELCSKVWNTPQTKYNPKAKFRGHLIQPSDQFEDPDDDREYAAKRPAYRILTLDAFFEEYKVPKV